MQKGLRMFKKITAFFVNGFWNCIFKPWTDEQVKKFYDGFDNYIQLSKYLQDKGFKWASDGANFCEISDFANRPKYVLARGWANCDDYCRLFEEFIKYKRCADHYEETLLKNAEGDWHFVTVIIDRNTAWLQSNMYVSLLQEHVIKAFENKYTSVEITDSWSK